MSNEPRPSSSSYMSAQTRHRIRWLRLVLCRWVMHNTVTVIMRTHLAGRHRRQSLLIYAIIIFTGAHVWINFKDRFSINVPKLPSFRWMRSSSSNSNSGLPTEYILPLGSKDMETRSRTSTNQKTPDRARAPTLPSGARVLDLTSGNIKPNKQLKCMKSNTMPSYHVCPHARNEDVFISRSLQDEGNWELELNLQLYRILKDSHPDATFVDIGAHIGVHALYAATLVKRIVAVEPNPMNHPNLIQGVQLNGLNDRGRRFLLVPHAVSDTRENVIMVTNMTNIGNTFIVSADAASSYTSDHGYGQTTNISSLLIDDLIPLISSHSPVIMKLDVEGHECRALAGAYKLLAALDVVLIYMETLFWSKDHDCMTEHMQRLAKEFKYTLRSMDGGPVDLKQLPTDVMWIKRR